MYSRDSIARIDLSHLFDKCGAADVLEIAKETVLLNHDTIEISVGIPVRTCGAAFKSNLYLVEALDEHFTSFMHLEALHEHVSIDQNKFTTMHG